MQQAKEYGQSLAPVNGSASGTMHGAKPCGPLRQRGQQTHRISVLIGNVRIRVSGNFDTIMAWIHLAMAEKQGGIA